MPVIWMALGGIAFAIGFIGLFLPLLPTVPLMLLAAFCFGKSSPRLEYWLLNHPRFGPPIRNWRRNGTISQSAKIWASVSISASLAISIALTVPLKIVIFQCVVLTFVIAFILSRPSHPR